MPERTLPPVLNFHRVDPGSACGPKAAVSPAHAHASAARAHNEPSFIAIYGGKYSFTPKK